MTKVFSLNDIINFAIEKEQQSYDLYHELAQHTPVAEIQKLFEELMQQELQHKIFYEQVLQITQDNDNDAKDIKNNKEYQAYMQQLIAESRTVKPLSKSDMQDMDKVLNFAIDREKDSILFYAGLRNFLPSQVQDKINIIIGEEAKHVAVITEIKHLIRNRG